MLEIVEYIFGNFWRWLGAFLMLGIIFEGIGGIGRRILIKKIIKDKAISKNSLTC